MQKYAERHALSEEEQSKLKNYPELLQALLFARGIVTEKDAELFLNPDYDSHVHDPFLMKGMDTAVERILKAIEKDERITIYSDYDCDGIPGGALMHDFFKEIKYDNFSNYIPHRHEEGYGLNIKAIEKLALEGARLIITVDVGITDVTPVARAKELGIDVIITDHHIPGDVLPDAYAVLNPKQDGDSYPDPMLCGSGVAFKLVQGILARNRFNLPEGKEKWLLDMVGLATIADMVPLLGENRVFAHFGLKVLRKSRRFGLQQLCKKMRVNQSYLTEDDIGFMVGPRINAASRMDKPMEAFRLLVTKDESEAAIYVERLHSLNEERKGVVAGMVREIKRRVRKRESLSDVLVVGDPRWRPSLLGLVANSLVDEYKRPVFLWGREGSDAIKGSCRSDGTADMVELMGKVKGVLIESGGHEQAGGFSILHEKVHLLEERLNAAYLLMSHKEKTGEVLFVDRKLSLDDVSWETYKLIERLSPFGQGNPKPIFLFPGIVIKKVKQFGRDNSHLELVFEGANGKNISAIGFFMTFSQFECDLKEEQTINLYATLEKSTFKSYPELRLRIVDIG